MSTLYANRPQGSHWEPEYRQRGTRAELGFCVAAMERGWFVSPSPTQANLHEHWDFLLTRGKEAFRVDVKSRKKLKRSDQECNDAYIWVEVQGKHNHDRGWLYDGTADLIALEREHDWLLIDKKKLRPIVENLCDLGEIVSSADEALYKVYSRPTLNDGVTLLRAPDVWDAVWEVWRKPESW